MQNRTIGRFEKVPKEQYLSDRIGVNTPTEEAEETCLKEYENLIIPKRQTMSSAGYDFVVPFDVVIGPTPILIPTGIRARFDYSYFLMLCPRSGLGMKYGMYLLNTLGVVDSDYFYAENFGHIMAKVAAEKEFKLKAGERFMQGIFVPYGIAENGNTMNRRSGGMGSTGA